MINLFNVPTAQEAKTSAAQNRIVKTIEYVNAKIKEAIACGHDHCEIFCNLCDDVELQVLSALTAELKLKGYTVMDSPSAPSTYKQYLVSWN